MLYELLYPLRLKAAWLGGLNVLRYIPFRAVAATLTAMLMSFLMSPGSSASCRRSRSARSSARTRPRTTR